MPIGNDGEYVDEDRWRAVDLLDSLLGHDDMVIQGRCRRLGRNGTLESDYIAVYRYISYVEQCERGGEVHEHQTKRKEVGLVFLSNAAFVLQERKERGNA